MKYWKFYEVKKGDWFTVEGDTYIKTNNIVVKEEEPCVDASGNNDYYIVKKHYNCVNLDDGDFDYMPPIVTVGVIKPLMTAWNLEDEEAGDESIG